MSKGVLYTMTLSLLSVALLSIAVLFIQHSTAAESRHVELSFTQKIIDIDSSIQSSFAEAIRLRNTTHVVMTNKSMTIYERLPTNYNTLDNILEDLETSIDSDISIVNVSTHIYNSTTIYNQTHAVILQPLNITYEHLSDSNVRIKQNSAVTGYNITFRTTGSISGCSQSITEGTISFEMVALGGGANCTVVNPSVSTASISFSVSGSPVNITIDATGQIDIQSSATIQSEITTYFGEMHDIPYAEVPILIQITDPSFYFVKEGYVRVW